MPSDDETQQASDDPAYKGAQPRAWMRWLRRSSASSPTGKRNRAKSPSVHATLCELPTLLDRSELPNGVVELLIEDFEAPIRQLFDIDDGKVTLVEPGKCVPWASIAGPPTAWALALGPERNTAELQLTGDEQLARRVLAALPQSA